MRLTNYSNILVVVLLFALLASGCTEDASKALHVGEKAPSFTIDLINGETTSLDQYSGKGVAITFMSSWCPCSNESVPIMKQTQQDHQADGLVIIMVGIQDSKAKFSDFIEKWSIPFPAGYDKGDRIAGDYGVRAPPTTVFVDKSGIVKRVFYGNIKDQEENFRGWIEEIL
jgi:peroxiredoxin